MVATNPHKRQLGQSPVEVVPLGVGCWAWGDQEYWHYGQDYGPREVVDAFETCLEAGLDFFDTAEAYAWGKGEQILGSLVQKSGRQLVVATKYAPLAGRGGPGVIAKGISGSLKRLRAGAVDLYQMHWADRDEAPIGPVMDVLAEAVKSGQVRAVGVSNYRANEMAEAHAALARHGIPLATNQVRYSLLHRSPEVDGVVEACRDLGITLLAYSPLEQGLLTGKYSASSMPTGKRTETPWFDPANVEAAAPVIAKVHEIGATHGVDASAVAIAWLLAQPNVIPLAGAKTGEQAARNAQALGVALTPAEIEDLDRVSAPWRTAE